MTDEEVKDQHSPRSPENWEKFKTWASEQNFLPKELADASSFQEAESIVADLKEENENEKEYYENLHELLQAVEKLYINMRLIDEKMRMVNRKV